MHCLKHHQLSPNKYTRQHVYFSKNVVCFEFTMCKKALFTDATAFFGIRVLQSDAGRRVLATLRGAPWHRLVELVVAGRQRSITHQPAHQGVFEGARNPAPHVASMFARPHPTRFSPGKACTSGFIRRCLACVRAKGGHFEHRL